jgi:hypothetical protein
MKGPTYPPGARGAFTLVELLVSTAVLGLLVIMVAQLTNNATITVNVSRKHLDADTQARMIFDRMAADFARMFHRKDVDYVFRKQAGNDQIFFYSEAPAYFSGTASKSSAALIGYRINSSLQLERLGKGLAWTGASNASSSGSVVFLTYPPASPAPAASPTPYPASTLAGNWPTTVPTGSTDSDFHAVGEQIYRFEFCFLMKDGTFSNTPYLAPHTSISGFQDVSAIVVALAILDSASQQIVSDNSRMVDALPDPSDSDLAASPSKLMAQTWLNAVNSSTFASVTGIPQPAASQVRVYQRSFYLNNP